MKRLFGVYVGGEWERNCGLREVVRLLHSWGERELSRTDKKRLEDGRGIIIDALICVK